MYNKSCHVQKEIICKKLKFFNCINSRKLKIRDRRSCCCCCCRWVFPRWLVEAPRDLWSPVNSLMYCLNSQFFSLFVCFFRSVFLYPSFLSFLYLLYFFLCLAYKFYSLTSLNSLIFLSFFLSIDLKVVDLHFVFRCFYVSFLTLGNAEPPVILTILFYVPCWLTCLKTHPPESNWQLFAFNHWWEKIH